MDVSDLRAFEAVARLGSMNRAAAELNTVQSNVTAKMLIPLDVAHHSGMISPTVPI
ncbi:LysR family transcriptional regulator [Bradyrhizobium brasilense]|uniref:LysR family transcriptional regulator n=1 Tax=Bradyrhizobium brasilense TaxID=1419277 RepID=UPI0026B5F549